MTILQIAVLTALALVIGQLRRGRQLAMLAVSVLALFWLQGPQPFSTLQYWLPLATLCLVVLSWIVTSTPAVRGLRENWPALAVMLAIAVLADSNRYFKLDAVYTALTPTAWQVALVIVAAAAVGVVVALWRGAQRWWLWIALLSMIVIFVVLKTPGLVQWVERMLSAARNAGAQQAAIPLTWLGYSYLAFRLMHTIRDRQTGRLPAVPLSDYMNYAIFFPAFTAGPIDRLERFDKDLCAPKLLTNEDWIEAGTRLFGGLFKKFVVADLLAVISINDTLVSKVQNGAWLWVFLYAYAFRIFLDFSGYTDIAIGMGRLMGIRLPENFAAPYLKPNLTQFWNSWHMTLTQWFRSYVFNPMTRAMRSAERPLPVWAVILLTQLTTMTLIGLWHGITICFVLWGLWHGIGLFIHNRWSDLVRGRIPAWAQNGRGLWITNAAGVFLTFNYVAIGWTFFTLTTPGIAFEAIRRLFGLG